MPAADFRRAEDVPLEGIQDPAVLALAARDRRILVSHDKNTMIAHFRDFTATASSPGLILIPQAGVTVGQAIEGLVLIWEISTRRPGSPASPRAGGCFGYAGRSYASRQDVMMSV